jgi:Tfp pilus assembly protein PilO
MNEFKKKFTIQLGINIGIIALLGGLLAYVSGDLRSVGKSIEQAVAAVAARAQAISSLSGLRQDAAEAGVIVNQLRNALPNRESLFVFSEEVNRLARERNLTPSFTFGNELPSESPSMPSKVEFVVNVAGEYESVLLFLNAFESSRYFTHVKSLEFLSQGINTTAYQAVLSGEVFFSE